MELLPELLRPMTTLMGLTGLNSTCSIPLKFSMTIFDISIMLFLQPYSFLPYDTENGNSRQSKIFRPGRVRLSGPRIASNKLKVKRKNARKAKKCTKTQRTERAVRDTQCEIRDTLHEIRFTLHHSPLTNKSYRLAMAFNVASRVCLINRSSGNSACPKMSPKGPRKQLNSQVKTVDFASDRRYLYREKSNFFLTTPFLS